MMCQTEAAGAGRIAHPPKKILLVSSPACEEHDVAAWWGHYPSPKCIQEAPGAPGTAVVESRAELRAGSLPRALL